MAIRPCPVVDKIFVELADILEACSERREKVCCLGCHLSVECHKHWNALSERAMRRYLIETDREWFMNWFDNISVEA